MEKYKVLYDFDAEEDGTRFSDAIAVISPQFLSLAFLPSDYFVHSKFIKYLQLFDCLTFISKVNSPFEEDK